MLTEKLKKAAKILKAGGVVAFPAETVFGIGAALNQRNNKTGAKTREIQQENLSLCQEKLARTIYISGS